MTEEAQTPKEPAAETPEAQAQAPAQPIDVFAVLRTCIALLENHAWQAMGLRPDPITGHLVKDLEQARIAIDSIAVLADRMGTHVQAADAREVTTLLTNLRLNFVRQQ